MSFEVKADKCRAKSDLWLIASTDVDVDVVITVLYQLPVAGVQALVVGSAQSHPYRTDLTHHGVGLHENELDPQVLVITQQVTELECLGLLYHLTSPPPLTDRSSHLVYLRSS